MMGQAVNHAARLSKQSNDPFRKGKKSKKSQWWIELFQGPGRLHLLP